MTVGRPPSITPAATGDNATGTGPGPPTRERLQNGRRGVLKRGEANKADLWLADLGGSLVVVKDFAAKAWWVRMLGRLQIRREARAYLRLGPIAGVPRFLGRIDAYALAIERVEGTELGRSAERARNGRARLAELRRILDRIHAAGVAHLDLRARENVLVGPAEEIWVVDFAGAVCLRPGGWPHRLFFGWFRSVDESAYLKWKRLLEAGPYTESERRFLRRHRFWRSLWIFNPRRR